MNLGNMSGYLISLKDILVRLSPKILVRKRNSYIDSNNLSFDGLNEVKTLLGKIVLLIEEEKIYAHEVTYIIDYNRVIRKIDRMITSIQSTN